ncbi:MAG TPA: type II secretion system minor pseudopilin GspK [Burkholderiaceae bacterium]|nr:type II secretion system minor pseudopilin GspK [Burkholderiaceae bacterium]
MTAPEAPSAPPPRGGGQRWTGAAGSTAPAGARRLADGGSCSGRRGVFFHRGAALLMAMITVTLVASLAAGALWQQWRAVEVETAERGRAQTAWVLTGALDWARLVLRADGRNGGPDHLDEPWAVPLKESRLSTFLAAERGVSIEGGDPTGMDVFLSGQIVDAQSRLNVLNLVNDGQISEQGQAMFERLFKTLGLPDRELQALTQGLRAAAEKRTEGTSNAPLWPTQVADLAWLGLSPQTLARLDGRVTLLPARTPLNLNTAEPELIYAAVPGVEMDRVQRAVALRGAKPFANLAEAAKALDVPPERLNADQHAIATRFFEIQGRLRYGNIAVQEISLVQRDGQEVSVLWRRRGVPLPTMAPPAAEAAPNAPLPPAAS